MPYYAITVQANRRYPDSSYSKDRAAIEGLIDLLKEAKDTQEMGDIGWEIGSKGNRLLHCHFLLVSKRAPYWKLKKYQNYIKANGLYADSRSLRSVLCLNRWVAYCHKNDHKNEQDEYERTYRPPSHRLI